MANLPRPGDVIAHKSTAFNATASVVGICQCGCGSVKIAFLDSTGVARSVAAFTPQGALEFSRNIASTALAGSPVEGRPS